MVSFDWYRDFLQFLLDTQAYTWFAKLVGGDPRATQPIAMIGLIEDVPFWDWLEQNGLAVVGGGYIGLELGSVYATLGSRVSVVEMTPGLLPGADRDLVKVLAQRVEKTFDRVMLSTKVTSLTASPKDVTVTFEGEGAPASATYDYVFVAIGRRPNAKISSVRSQRSRASWRR